MNTVRKCWTTHGNMCTKACVQFKSAIWFNRYIESLSSKYVCTFLFLMTNTGIIFRWKETEFCDSAHLFAHRNHVEIVFNTWRIQCTSQKRNSLQWRHNGRDGVSNHRCPNCLLNRLFRQRSKKTPKIRVTGLCEGNSPLTGKFPAQKFGNAECFYLMTSSCIKVSIDWAISVNELPESANNCQYNQIKPNQTTSWVSNIICGM